MKTFSYRAIDEYSTIHEGSIAADTLGDLERILSGQGMTLIDAESSSLFDIDKLFAIKFSLKDLLEFTYMFKLVVNSGIPIMNGIQDLLKGHTNKKLTFAATALYKGLDSGQSLSEVMETQPRIFPAYYVHMVRAGEASGTLDNSLEFLMNYLNWQIEFKKTIRGHWPIRLRY
jgi:type II secretory pathway component PulF